MNQEKLIELEYRTLNENIRWWSNIRFAQLTLFFLITAAIFRTVNDPDSGLTSFETFVMKIGGVGISLAFGYLEYRANEYWTYFENRARKIEARLKFSQFSGVQKRRLRTSHVLWFLFLSVLIYWLLEIIVPFYFNNLI